MTNLARSPPLPITNIVLDDNTEERFRKAVADNKGMKKGNISIALEEAIELWMNKQKKREEK
jgi:hypothetical protein